MAHSILLVDDERPLLSLLTKFLERRGYQVAACETGQAALALFREDPARFSLVVLDLKLPDVPGDELLTSLLDISPTIRVLICSGSAWSPAHLPEAHQPRTASILKPFMPNALVETIEDLLA
ncbi:MAG: response regulator [Bryobacteraceae bacterium]|nr:response regulator [Bryobacteraceae bacterium]